MDIILLEDIKNLGKRGDKVTVKDGYARNLLAKKQAAEANAKTLNDMKLLKIHEEKLAEQKLREAEELKDKLTNLSVTVSIKIGKDGKVFGSVSSKEIAEAAKDQLGIDIDKKKLVLPEPIRELGKTAVPLKLHPQVTGSITVNVTEG